MVSRSNRRAKNDGTAFINLLLTGYCGSSVKTLKLVIVKKLEVASSPVCVLRAQGPELRVYAVGYTEAILTLEGDCRAQGPELRVCIVE